MELHPLTKHICKYSVWNQFLNIDHIYQSKLSGERNGKQAFTSINFRTKNRFGKFNTTPSLKFDLGVTQLSEMTDLIRNPNDPLIKKSYL